jgi:RNA polymerase sigma factor (sigma-70 family)
LTAVYREYVRPVYGLLSEGFSFGSGQEHRRFLGCRSLPWALENAVQETFVRAFATPARQAYDGLRPYRNYLFSIARNLVVDELRSGGREVLVDHGRPLDDGAPGPDEPLVPADDQVLDQELAAQCEAFLAALDEPDRRLFEVRFLQSLSVEACARRLAVSEHHVKSS